MPDLRWLASANADLKLIIDYISDDNPDAADLLLQDIEMRVIQLLEQPRRGRVGRVAGTRELVVKPNYIVVYAESPDVVEILRVLHAARLWP